MYKILLACPISDLKEYILWQWLEYIQNFTLPVDIILVDNSHTSKLQQEICIKYPKIIYYRIVTNINDKTRRHDMAESMNVIRSYAIKNNYNYLFSLECDVFPPYNIIECLLRIKNDVAAATYFIDHGADSKLMLQRFENPNFGNDTVIRMMTQNEGFAFADGTVKNVFSPGLGCVLINTDILRQIIFRVENSKDSYQAHHDFFFYKDLYTLKIPVKVDTSIICKHINSSWYNIYVKK